MSVPCAQVTLAPSGVLRAAAWPIESLDGFGDHSLAQESVAAISSNANWSSYVADYERVFARERQHLQQITLEDSRFLKALCLSNPIVSGKVKQLLARKGQLQPRNKMIRRLENTLYRYLARAVGRTTPNGLWAGVGLVNFQEKVTQSTATVKAQYYFAPDLRPFQTILRSLARQTTYRDRLCWQINPTLNRQPDLSWYFWARTETGQVEQRIIDSNQIIDQLLKILIKQETGTFAQLLTSIQTKQAEIPISTVPNLLEILADNGVLQGGLDLPNRFSTVWDALNIAAQLLTPAHQSMWNEVIDKLQNICYHLATDIEVMTLADLEFELTTATKCVRNLAQSLGVVLPDFSVPILHCDLKLPIQLTLDQLQRDVLLQTLSNYESCWLDGISPTTALRQWQRQQLGEKLQQDLSLAAISPDIFPQNNWSALLTREKDVNASVVNQMRAWEALLITEESEVILDKITARNSSDNAKAPLSCLYVSMWQRFQLQVRGIDDDPARAFARFGNFLDAQKCLHNWLKQNLAILGDRHQVTIAELQVPFEANPNVLARDSFCAEIISLWNPHKDSLSLQGAKLGINTGTCVPFLKLPSISYPLAVFGFSAANVSGADPLAELLFYTSFQERPIANVAATAFPTSKELTDPYFSPRICLTSGAIIRPRRTVLNGTILEKLVQATPPKRYAYWQKLAKEYDWPELLNLQVDQESSLLLKRDSPLALEALFKSVRKQTQWLIIEELVDLPWLVDAQNQHYIAEMALPFLRAKHGWSHRS